MSATTSATPAKVIELLEEATQTPPGQIAAATVLEDFNGWDSMGMVTFIALVDSYCGVTIRVQDLQRCPTPAALAQLIQARIPA